MKDRSTKEQKDAIQKLCEENRLILDNVYEDAAISGTSTAGRDGFHLMISELRKPDARRSIAGVIVWSLSRFSRNFDDSQFFKAELRRLGYQIFSMSDKIEDSLDGRLLESINDYLNEKYARQVSFDVKRALRSDFLNFGVIKSKGIKNSTYFEQSNGSAYGQGCNRCNAPTQIGRASCRERV